MFTKLAHDAIAGKLTARSGMLDVRANTRRNIVAADAGTEDAMGALLAITSICGIEVSPCEPLSSSTGVIVVDSMAITAEAVASSLETLVPVQSAGELQCTCASWHPSPLRSLRCTSSDGQ